MRYYGLTYFNNGLVCHSKGHTRKGIRELRNSLRKKRIKIVDCYSYKLRDKMDWSNYTFSEVEADFRPALI